MKLSQFTVIVNDYPQKDHHLLYHTLSRALIEVDKTEWDLLQNLPKGLDFRENAVRDIPNNGQSGAFFSALTAQGFLVPKALNEGERYLKHLSRHPKKKGGQVTVTLLTNLQRCPLACSYCYQKGTHTGGRLEGDVSDKSLAFIKAQCERLDAERLFISYYGSEPLSNPKAIVETAAFFQQFCQERGMRFQFGMVTSGVLLTRKIVEKLLPLGFVQVQITIDGNQETHDASRPFQSGKGTYAVIMKNLNEYAGLIHTDVLCVLSESRVSAAYQLVDALQELGLAERRVRLKFSTVMPTYDNESIAAAQLHVDDGQIMMAERKLLVSLAKLSIYAAEKGLIDDLRPKHAWCAMQRHDGRHLTLDPSGKLYTCPTLIGRAPKYEAGHLSTGMGGIDTVIKEQYMRSEQCLQCRYLPICADCRVDALYRKGDITAANPKEEEYDSIVPQLIKAHYRLCLA